jgi:hypothetical protein
MENEQRRKFGDSFHVSALPAAAFRVIGKGSLG